MVVSKTFMFCARNYNRIYRRDEDFARKLQIIFTKILCKCVLVSYEFLYYGNCHVITSMGL